jgi:hypothetical protein
VTANWCTLQSGVYCFSSPRLRGRWIAERDGGGTFALAPPRGFGTVQCVALLALKPSRDSWMPAQPRQDTLRLRVLTRLNWRASHRRKGRRNGAVKALERSVPLQPHCDILTIEPRFGTGIACTKARPRRLACLVCAHHVTAVDINTIW